MQHVSRDTHCGAIALNMLKTNAPTTLQEERAARHLRALENRRSWQLQCQKVRTILLQCHHVAVITNLAIHYHKMQALLHGGEEKGPTSLDPVGALLKEMGRLELCESSDWLDWCVPSL
jgi:hypothetical protein